MNKPTVLIIVDKPIDSNIKHDSHIDLKLFASWIKALHIEKFQLCTTKDLEKIKKWKGPLLAVGHRASSAAMLAGKPCPMMPHPFKNSSALPVIHSVLMNVRGKLWPRPKPGKIKIVKE